MEYLYTNITTWSRTITRKDWPLIENFKEGTQTEVDWVIVNHRTKKQNWKLAQIEDIFDGYILTSVLDIYKIQKCV